MVKPFACPHSADGASVCGDDGQLNSSEFEFEESHDESISVLVGPSILLYMAYHTASDAHV